MTVDQVNAGRARRESLRGAFLVLSASVILCVSGCFIPATYKDASNRSEFSQLLRSRYRTRVELFLNAVRLDIGAKSIDFYDLTLRPGGDPAVLFSKALPTGTVLEALRYEQCANCWLGSMGADHLIVKLPDSQYHDHPVRLVAWYGGTEIVVHADNNMMQLNPSLFERMAQ